MYLLDHSLHSQRTEWAVGQVGAYVASPENIGETRKVLRTTYRKFLIFRTYKFVAVQEQGQRQSRVRCGRYGVHRCLADDLDKDTAQQAPSGLRACSLHQLHEAAGAAASEDSDRENRAGGVCGHRAQEFVAQQEQPQTREDSVVRSHRAQKLHETASPGRASLEQEGASKPSAQVPVTRSHMRKAAPTDAAAQPNVHLASTLTASATDGDAASARGGPMMKEAKCQPESRAAPAKPAAAAPHCAGGLLSPIAASGPTQTASIPTLAKVTKSARGDADKVKQRPRDPVLRSKIMVLDVAAAAVQAEAGIGADGLDAAVASGRRTRGSVARTNQQPVLDKDRLPATSKARGLGRGVSAKPAQQAAETQPCAGLVRQRVNGASNSGTRTASSGRIPPDVPSGEQVAKRRSARGAAAAAAAGITAAAGVPSAVAAATTPAGLTQAPLQHQQQPAAGPMQALPVVRESQDAQDDDEASRPKKRPRKGPVQAIAHAAAAPQQPATQGKNAATAGRDSGKGPAEPTVQGGPDGAGQPAAGSWAMQALASVATEDRQKLGTGVEERTAKGDAAAPGQRKRVAKAGRRKKAGAAAAPRAAQPGLQTELNSAQQVIPNAVAGAAEKAEAKCLTGPRAALNDGPVEVQQLPVERMMRSLGTHADREEMAAVHASTSGGPAAHVMRQAGSSGERQPVVMEQQLEQQRRMDASVPVAPQVMGNECAGRRKKRKRAPVGPDAAAVKEISQNPVASEPQKNELQHLAREGDGACWGPDVGGITPAEVQHHEPAPASAAAAPEIPVAATSPEGVGTATMPSPAATRNHAAEGPCKSGADLPGSPVSETAEAERILHKLPVSVREVISPAGSVAQSNLPRSQGAEALDKGGALKHPIKAQVFGASLHMGASSWSNAELLRQFANVPMERRPTEDCNGCRVQQQYGTTYAAEMASQNRAAITPGSGRRGVDGGQRAAAAPRQYTRPIPPPPRFDAEPHTSQPGPQLDSADEGDDRNPDGAMHTHGGGRAKGPGGFFVQRGRDYGVQPQNDPHSNQGDSASEALDAPEAAFPPTDALRSKVAQEAGATYMVRRGPMVADRGDRVAFFHGPAAASAGVTTMRNFYDAAIIEQVPCLPGSGQQEQWRQRPTDLQRHQSNTAGEDEYRQGGSGLGTGHALSSDNRPSGLQFSNGGIGDGYGIHTRKDPSVKSGPSAAERQGAVGSDDGAQRQGIPDSLLQAGLPKYPEPQNGYGLAHNARDTAELSCHANAQAGPTAFGLSRDGMDPAIRWCPEGPRPIPQGEPGGPIVHVQSDVHWQRHAPASATRNGSRGCEPQVTDSITDEHRTGPPQPQQSARYRSAASIEQQASHYTRPPRSDQRPPWQTTVAAAAPESRVANVAVEAEELKPNRDSSNDQVDAIDVDDGGPGYQQTDVPPSPPPAPPQQHQQPRMQLCHGQPLDDPYAARHQTGSRQQQEFPACAYYARPAGQPELRQPQSDIGHGTQGDSRRQPGVPTTQRGEQNSFPDPSSLHEPLHELPRQLEPKEQYPWHGSVLESVQEGPGDWRSAAVHPAASQVASVQPHRNQFQEQQPGSSEGVVVPQPGGRPGPPAQQRRPQPQTRQFVVPSLRSNRVNKQHREYQQMEHPATQQQPHRVLNGDGRMAAHDRQPTAAASAPVPASSSEPSAVESIRRALSRADGVQKRNRTRELEITDREEDGWTLEQVQELQTAYFKTDPTHPNFWREVARHVHGKTAGECFIRVYASVRNRDERALMSKVLRRQPAPAAGGTATSRPITLAAARKWSQKAHEQEQLERLAHLRAVDEESQDEATDEDVDQGEGQRTSIGRSRKPPGGGQRWLRQFALPDNPTEIRSILDDLDQKRHADRFITSFLHKQGGWAKWHKAVKEASERRVQVPDASRVHPCAGGDSIRPGQSAKLGQSRDDTLARVIRHMLAEEKMRKQRQEWREEDRAEGLEDEDESVGEPEEPEDLDKEGRELLQYLLEEGLVGPDGLPVL
ncbi:hypothetical protein VOLCADRAFT_93053 [Volvox carteri f. nagariensis]|uniref:Myb-like domain-containing protein n=1 Tax=Volvox carteri f. nagariensis TaxID=3068 RepID=D8U180_VOLCA|nr:uncharacterized protein VOLCADRAFT_93053 [Volvox carteri f. nagariensis]EFJ46510.1 hypothetical protein VOLCADRAFT_93053 [Volvox carteri f. nagariensis]|eukprot:XP_002952367.1 hypothetical protein VOLCADRAFT_93053 [Volvox carteri f. nagariensis]